MDQITDTQITDTLYAHADGVHSVSCDPSDGRFCVWCGDAFITSRAALDDAIAACDARAARVEAITE